MHREVLLKPAPRIRGCPLPLAFVFASPEVMSATPVFRLVMAPGVIVRAIDALDARHTATCADFRYLSEAR